MKRKIFSILFALALMLSFSLIPAVPAMANGVSAIIEVSQPTYVTSDNHYERGQSILKDSSGNYWLFYGRSEDCIGNYNNPTGGAVDSHHYVVYYKRANSIAGLETATPVLVSDMPGTSGGDRIYQGQTSCVEFGGYVWLFAGDASSSPFTLKYWRYSVATGAYVDNGTVGGITYDGSVTHQWATVFDNKLVVAYDQATMKTVYTSDGTNWTAGPGVASEGMPRLFADGTTLYLSWSSWGAPGHYYIYNTTGTFSGSSTWTQVKDLPGEATWYPCDPFLSKVNGNYMFVSADMTTTYSKQYVHQWTSSSVAGLSGSPLKVTNGGYGTDDWVDMWPVIFNDGGTSYLFYTSERGIADETVSGTGNIWYMPIDWPLTNNHFEAIQPAIDAATETTIKVAAGEYTENISMLSPVNLIGTGVSAPVIKGTLTINHSSYSGSEATLIEGIAFVTKIGVTHDNIVLKGVEDITIKNCSFDGAGKFMEGGSRAIQMSDPVNKDVLIDNCTFTNGYYVTIQGNVEGLTVVDSAIQNVKSGINHQYGRNLVVRDTDFSVVAQGAGSDTYGIRFASSSGSVSDLSVAGGSIQVDKAGLVANAGIYHSAIIIRAGATGALTVHKVTIYGEVVNQSPTQLDAENNWWGANDGPSIEGAGPGHGDKISGNVDADPWLKLNISANPDRIVANGTSTSLITADMTKNSKGDVTGSPYIPDGTKIIFTTDKGSIGSLNVETKDGKATATLTSSKIVETANVSAVAPGDPTYSTVSTTVFFTPAGSASTAANTNLGAVNFSPSNGFMTPVTTISPGNMQNLPAGYSFPYGFFGFNINNLTSGGSTQVTINFPNPLPLGVKYFKIQNGQSVDCSSIMTRPDPHTIILRLTDGGVGDADGIANGTIVDPGGPAIPLSATPTSHQSSMPIMPQAPVQLSNINVKAAALSATKVSPGSQVTVTANVANTGTGNGSSLIKFYVNGSEEYSQPVTVNSGGSTTVTHDIIRNEPGTYTVYVNGTNAGSFTVDMFAGNDMLIYGIIALFTIGIIGTLYLLVRRRTY